MSDQNFYIRKILEKKWEYNGTVRQLFIDFKRATYQLGGKDYTIFSLSLVYPGNWLG
jgi:hypothetical protein